jgi:hypothetical protein
MQLEHPRNHWGTPGRGIIMRLVCSSGLVHQAKGEQEATRKRLEAALAICARLGERLYAEQMEQALAGLER